MICILLLLLLLLSRNGKPRTHKNMTYDDHKTDIAAGHWIDGFRNRNFLLILSKNQLDTVYTHAAVHARAYKSNFRKFL